jgi:hypothetical protein
MNRVFHENAERLLRLGAAPGGRERGHSAAIARPAWATMTVFPPFAHGGRRAANAVTSGHTLLAADMYLPCTCTRRRSTHRRA